MVFSRRVSQESMRISPLIGVLLLFGCYSYHALEYPTPASGTRVAAELTDAGSLQLASQIGPGVSSVRGEVVESSAEGLLLALSSVLGRNQQEMFWNGEQVRIPKSAVARVQQRRFSLGKSAVFMGVVAGGLLVAVKAFTGAGAAGGGAGNGGGPAPE